MSQIHKLVYRPDEADEADRAAADRQTQSLGGIAIALLLVVIGLFLFRVLHEHAVMQDCVMSGSRACIIISHIP
jgi:hypothetical protein